MEVLLSRVLERVWAAVELCWSCSVPLRPRADNRRDLAADVGGACYSKT